MTQNNFEEVYKGAQFLGVWKAMAIIITFLSCYLHASFFVTICGAATFDFKPQNWPKRKNSV